MITQNELTKSVLATLSPSPRRPQLDTFLHFIYLMSLSYLQHQDGIAQQCKRLGTSTEELACETLEDLLQTNTNNVIFKVKQFFETRGEPSLMRNTELFTASRMLAIGATERTISRSCLLLDPSLFSLAKSIKEIAGKKSQESLFLLDDELFLGGPPAHTSQPASLHRYPTGFLCAELKQRLSKRPTKEEIVSLLRSAGNEQKEYFQAIPLVQATIVMKMLLPSAQQQPYILPKETTNTICASVIEQLHVAKTLSYARSNTFSLQEAESHFDAVYEIVRDDLTLTAVPDAKLYHVLSRHLANLDEETYLKKHQGQFEPLAREAKTLARRLLLRAL